MWAAVALFVGLACLSACAFPAAAAAQTDHNAEGLKALEAEQYEEAAKHFSLAAAADAKDFYAHFHLAYAFSALGKQPEAIAAYRKVLALRPELYEAHLNLGILLIEAGEAAAAAEHLHSAVEKKPEEYRPNYYLAEALLQNRDLEAAEKHYEAALKARPGSAEARLGLGQAQAGQRKWEEALANYQGAAVANPKLREYLLELADMLERAQRLEDAVSLLKQFPDSAAARERMGQLLLETGKATEAVLQLEAVVKESPTTANRLALAMAYLRSEQSGKAVVTLKQAMAAEPDHYDLHMVLGRILRDMRNFQAAAKEFEIAARLRPDSAQAYTEWANMLVSLNQFDAALMALDKVRELEGQSAGHAFLKALVLDKLQRDAEALVSYREFLELSKGEHADQEFQARQRIQRIEKLLNKR
jgi:protein O-GlcNAc transferase